MCVVSMVIDHKTQEWQRKYPIPNPTFIPQYTPLPKPPTKFEIDEFRRLLERAREYDKKNSEPECEMEDKKQVLKELAQKLGIDISFIDKE